MEKKKAAPPYLSSELVTQILLSLPVKSLIRFKCVCKLWFSLISDPNFAISQFHLSQATNNRRILCSSRFWVILGSIDFESSINHESTSLNLNPLPQSCFPLDIKGSCRGFIFLKHLSTFSLWNPSTGFHRTIRFAPMYAARKAYRFTNLYGFGYDESRDDYLLVLISSKHKSHLEFFSLRDNRWTEIKGPHFPYMSSFHHNVGTWFNGAIHWLADRCDLMVGSKVIAVFDLTGRKLFDMSLPHHLDHALAEYDLLVSEEFLSLCGMQYDNPTPKFEMWVMKDYKLHSSWTKILDLFLDHPTPNFYPICITKSGDIIGTDGADGLIKYNDKGQCLEYRNNYNTLGQIEVAVYTESLLSLPGNSEQV